MGVINGVLREEASIVRGLNPTGLLVVNGDDDDIGKGFFGAPDPEREIIEIVIHSGKYSEIFQEKKNQEAKEGYDDPLF